MQIYKANRLVKEFTVGTGKLSELEKKTRFGEYVTPTGDYIIINKFSRENLKEKFGKNWKLYGIGMLQLSGPWAPHIAIHGTFDNSKIGNYKSNGCINLKNEDLEWLLENAGIESRVYIY